MVNEEDFDEPAENRHAPTRNEHSEQEQPLQIRPPLLNDGPELMRDTHC